MRIPFILLFFFLFLQCSAQLNERLDSIVSKYSNYHKTEKEFFYTHFNKAVYFPGENIWFKVYVLDYVSRQPFLPTRNLHAELYGPSGKLVQKKLLYVAEASTHGDFRLSDTLPPGTYTFRAYTNWSKNFGEHFTFTQPLTVVGKTVAAKEAAKSLTEHPDVQFFPEGGSLIADIQNTVAFKVVNRDGFGMLLQGTLKLDGKSLQTITSNSFGMGRFNLLPKTSGVYTAVFPSPGRDSFAVDLPKPIEKGITLTVDAVSNDSVLVTVLTNVTTLKEVRGQDFHIMVHRQGNGTFFKGTFGRFHKFSLPKSYFPQGVAHLTLFDHQNRPIADRAVFMHPPRTSLNVTSKRQGDSVQVEFLTSLADKPLSSNLSVSLLPVGTEADDFGRNIYSRYFLEGDIKGFIEHPSYYFEGDRDGRKADLDNLLLVHGWRSYNWNTILNSKADTMAHAFYQGLNFKGKIPGYRQASENDSTVLTLLSPANNITLTSKVKADGTFEFPYLYLRDSSQLALTTTAVKWQSSLVAAETELVGISFDSATISPVHLVAKKTVNSQQAMIANAGDLEEVIIRTKAPEQKVFQNDPYVNNHDREYKIDDAAIRRHRNLTDLLRTQFGINSTEDGAGNVIIQMVNGPFSIGSANLPPTLIVDGMAMGSLNLLRTLRVTDVEAIAVNRYGNTMLGSRGAGGSIVIKTRTDPNALRPKQEDAVKNIFVRGYATPSAYFSPTYSVPRTHPSFIKYGAIHWEPRVITDGSGKGFIRFALPKELTGFLLKAEGITVNGEVLMLEKEFRF